MERDRPRVRRSFFRTEDVGYEDLKGYFYILDRQKDMIVTLGENVYCGEVEAVIFNRPAVREAAVFGMLIRAVKQKRSVKTPYLIRHANPPFFLSPPPF